MRLLGPRVVAAIGWWLAGAVAGTAEPAPRPNVVIILADDLGFSDLGSYGGEIETPNLDGLARAGLRFTQLYNTARCWPSRAALLTGYYPQQIRYDVLPGYPMGEENGPRWARLLPERLRSAGYRSYHSGKWHLGGKPLESGFDRSYRLEDLGRYFNPSLHYEDDKPLPPVPPGTGYYATTAIAEHAVRHLQEHAGAHADQPFFQLIAFSAPHFPLQALADDVAYYRERYRRGWDEVRQERWERIQAMDLVPGELSPVEPRIGPPYHFPGSLAILGPGEVNRPVPWRKLTAHQREFQATKMAIHAAMIHRMDREVGRVLDQLRAMGAFDDTLVLFLSDNGASAEIMVADTHDPAAAPGSASTYFCLGPGWSTVSNTPFRRHKTWVHEGGISTPLVAHWPRGIAARGELRDVPGHVIDVVPTVLQLAGIRTSGDWKGAPLPGRSLVAAFRGEASAPREYLWWLHEGNRALRVGDYKIVSAGPKGAWELYDVSKDRAESNNLAGRMPEKVRELATLWWAKVRQFAADAGLRPGPLTY